MKSIGGYFELELRRDGPYYNTVCLNTGRNCLEYILRLRKYKRIYIPYYTCEAILEPIHKLNIDYKFYHIDKLLNPIFDTCLEKDEAFLYTNYFGMKQDIILHLVKEIPNLIIDNAQAFFANPLKGIDTFNSTRKFFGVADGAYLFTNDKLEINLKTDESYRRMSHLLKRIDLSPEEGFESYQKHEQMLCNQEIKNISPLSDKILKSLDYESIIKIRRKNFNYLQEELGKNNELKLPILDNAVPMVYPFLITKEGLKSELIKKKIYVATYWNNVMEWCNQDSIEYTLAKYLLPLPIDQRYDQKDMDQIISTINNYEKL